MADARELIEAAEALGEPRPDPRTAVWNAIRAVIDLLIERGLDPAILADQLVLTGHAFDPRLGGEAAGMLAVEGWEGPAWQDARPAGAHDDQHVFIHLTRRLVALLVHAPSRTRIEVMAARVDSDGPQLDLAGWRQLLAALDRGAFPGDVEATSGRLVQGRRFPTPAEVLERMQDPGPVEDLVPEGMFEEQHPTPQEMVERAGAYTVGVDHGTDPPTVYQANRSFSARMGEMHWEPGAIARLLGLDAPAPEAPPTVLDGADLARSLADVSPPAEPRNRAERRRRRRGGL